jgi:outer membrane protein OmpA-like peptidoglycan-associated protein
MASKKYILLAGIICLLATGSYGQVGASYDVKDSSLIPAKRMPQHSEFLNGTYNFPAKPRNQWEIGVKVGAFTISSDVPSVFPTLGFGAHVRKAFGYVFSARLEYMYGTAKGLQWNPANEFGRNSAWIPRYGAPLMIAGGASGQPTFIKAGTNQLWTGTSQWDNVFYNYKTKAHDLSLEGVITLNNIRFHKAKTGFNLYGFAGIGATIFEAKVNALDENGNTYATQFNTIAGQSIVYKNRKDIRDALKDAMDDTYETLAENEGGIRRPKLFGKTLKPSASVGAGMAFKLSNRLNLAIEDRHTLVKTDLLDGQRWQEHGVGDPVLTPDYDSYNYLSIGLNINIGAKAVEPLWWLNPLDYAYSEIRNPRLMRLPKPVLPDSDLDGVTDQFDQEQTPEGCPVDTHGVTRDTDGDGVPDCKDKELITPTYCQPVDADGIGKCPVPCPDTSCYRGLKIGGDNCAEKLGALPSVTFNKNSVKLSDDAKRLLAVVADRMRNSPGCNVVVTGYCAGNKVEQQRSWDRVNAIINYLIEKEGVSGDRLIFKYGEEGGDCDTVDIRPANEGEEGPNTVPAPHPNLRKG